LGLKQCYLAFGKMGPEIVTADNCCAVQATVKRVFPNTHVVEDIWHFVKQYVPEHTIGHMRSWCQNSFYRYTITLMNGANNPLHLEVKKSITSCLVSQTADKATNQIAIYCMQEDQEEWMIICMITGPRMGKCGHLHQPR
jgi:hypothetical protein